MAGPLAMAAGNARLTGVAGTTHLPAKTHATDLP